MNHKWVFRIFVCTLVMSILPACSQNNAHVPPTSTFPPPTVTQTPTLPPPTATLEPTQRTFVNPLIYDTPEMYQVNIETVQFPTLSDPSVTLPMNIYYPPDRQADKLLPAVILPNDFQKNGKLSLQLGGLLWIGWEAWGRIIAANGLIAVAYDTLYPNDLEAVVTYIQQNSIELGIDGNRLSLFAMSSNTTLAGSFAYQKNREYLKFVVFYYGNPEMLDSPGLQDCYTGGIEYGWYCSELPEVTQLSTDLPILVVRCGLDSKENLADIDYFIQQAEEQGVPLTLIRNDIGDHGFDWLDKSTDVTSREKGISIIKQTIQFMKENAFVP